MRFLYYPAACLVAGLLLFPLAAKILPSLMSVYSTAILIAAILALPAGIVADVKSRQRLKLRNWVSFRGRRDSGSDEEQPKGKAIALWIAEELRAKGCANVETRNHGDWAWDISAAIPLHSFLCILALVDDGPREWAVHLESLLFTLQRIFGADDRAELALLAKHIHLILSSDARISEIRWYSETEWDQDPDNAWRPSPE